MNPSRTIRPYRRPVHPDADRQRRDATQDRWASHRPSYYDCYLENPTYGGDDDEATQLVPQPGPRTTLKQAAGGGTGAPVDDGNSVPHADIDAPALLGAECGSGASGAMPTADVWAVLSFSAGSDAQPHGGPSTPAAPPPPHADVLDCPADIGVATLESGSPSAVAAATVEGRRDGERTGATAHGESAAWDGWWLSLLSSPLVSESLDGLEPCTGEVAGW